MVSFRIGKAWEIICGMSAAQETSRSSVLRAMLGEAMQTHIQHCRSVHRGPIRDGVCGHCGGTAPR